MDMISLNSIVNEKEAYSAYSVSVTRQAETNKEISSENNFRSDVDCFRELCEKFPSASFVVEDNSFEITSQDWLPKRFAGNSNLENFSNFGTLSIAFDVKIFEKAAKDPEFMEKLTMFVEHLNNEWSSKEAQCLSDGMTNVFVEMYLQGDGTLVYTTGEYQVQFDLYYKQQNNLSAWQADGDIVKRILEEYERQRQEGLFSMMDKIHENSEELKEQIENDRKEEVKEEGFVNWDYKKYSSEVGKKSQVYNGRWMTMAEGHSLWVKESKGLFSHNEENDLLYC